MDIELIRQRAASLTTAQLEAEKQARDEQVIALRAEMQIIHDLLEPRWVAAQRASAGPANLRQRIG